jgi:hypothetical protein
MSLESSAQTKAATVLANGVSPKSGRRRFGPKPIASLLARLGLRFGDPAVEDQYRAYFAEHAIYRTRIAMGLAVVTNAVFGIWDLTSASGGLMSTRFRFMVALPAFGILLAISFHRSMKRWWQEYSILFCIVLAICMYKSVVFFDTETEFNIARGNGTLNFQLAVIFGALFPIRFLYMVLVQAIFQTAHALLLYNHAPPDFYLTTYFSFVLNCASTVVCLIAYWRETVSRRQFARALARGQDDRPNSGISYVGDGYLEGSGEPVAKTTPQNSPRITISYRRGDSGIITGRIFDRLADHYGKNSVFRDIDNIPAGVDFREHIQRTLDQSDVVLAIVGPRWVGSHSGRDRLSEPSDPVRVEVETALQKGKPLIPVLVLNARMPVVEHLPSSLHDFAFRNAVTIDAERDFDVHMARLIRSIDQIANKAATDGRGDSNC